MRGVYTATIKCAGLASAKTLILVTPIAGINIRLLEASITDASNATNQQLEAIIARVLTVGSPAGTAITPTKAEAGDQASPCTVIGNLSAEPGAYAATLSKDEGLSSISGWFYEPIPEVRLVIAGSTPVGLKLAVAPAAPTDIIANLTWVEEG